MSCNTRGLADILLEVSHITEQEKDTGNSMIAEISEHTGLREISDEEYDADLTLLSMSDGVSDRETVETMLKLSSGMGGGRAQRGGANSKVVHFISILCIAAAAGISLKIAFYIAGKFGLFAVAERGMVIAEAQINSCGSLAEGVGQHVTHKYAGKLVGNNLDHIIPSCSNAWENLETAREALGTTTAQFTERLLGAGVLISFAGYNKVYAAVDSLLDFCFIENTQAVTEGPATKQGGRKRTKSRRKQGGKKSNKKKSNKRTKTIKISK